MKEFSDLQEKLNRISKNDPCLNLFQIFFQTNCCEYKTRLEYGLPCVHFLYNRYKEGKNFLLTDEDIPNIYYLSVFDNVFETSIKVITDENSKINCSYYNLMDMVSPIASEAARNKDVQRLFNNFFDDFNNLKFLN